MEELPPPRPATLIWLRNSAALAPLGIMTAMATTPLGPNTNPAIAAALTATTILGLALAHIGHPSRHARNAARVSTAGIMAGTAAMLTALLLTGETGQTPAGNGYPPYQGVALLNQNRLEATEHRVELTIQEIEKGRMTAEAQWPPARGAPQVLLHLYPNLTQYQEGTGLPGAGGHTLCIPQGPLVVIPLDPEPGIIPSWGRRTPQHEMTHAALCRHLGPRAYAQLPAWFHEGAATTLEFQGAGRMPLRATRRLSAWLSPHQLPEPQGFCTPHPILEHRNSQGFYTMAHEFTMHLRAQHGPNIMQLIAGDVARNEPMRESIRQRTGYSCQQLYRQWLESWNFSTIIPGGGPE